MDGIYNDTNICVEILTSKYLFILVKVAFFLEEVQQSGLIIKPNEQAKYSF